VAGPGGGGLVSIGPAGGGAKPGTTGEGALLKPLVLSAAVSAGVLPERGDAAGPVGIEECSVGGGPWYGP
jgi:hypothetical protein